MPHTKKKRERDAASKPEKCIGKYVCIENDSTAYPGFVEDAGLAQVYANCMHSVGKEMLNCFFFSFLPRCFLDLTWYDHDQIPAIIPKPLLKPGTTSHFEIDHDMWIQIVDKLNG